MPPNCALKNAPNGRFYKLCVSFTHKKKKKKKLIRKAQGKVEQKRIQITTGWSVSERSQERREAHVEGCPQSPPSSEEAGVGAGERGRGAMVAGWGSMPVLEACGAAVGHTGTRRPSRITGGSTSALRVAAEIGWEWRRAPGFGRATWGSAGS